MNDRFLLMNRLYQLIVSDQVGTPLEDSETAVDKHAREVLEPLKQLALKLTYSNGGNRHETMLQLAKLYTAGLITFTRDKGDDFVIKGVKDPDVGILTEFNDNLQR